MNIEELLSNNDLTFPVKVKFSTPDGKGIDTTIHYRAITAEIEKQINEGEGGQPLSIPAQLALLVKSIDGVNATFDVAYFERMHAGHRRQSIDAVMNDVYPDFRRH